MMTYRKRNTLTARDLQCAVKLLLSDDLALHAISEGTKSIYHLKPCCFEVDFLKLFVVLIIIFNFKTKMNDDILIEDKSSINTNPL
jgi:hypothetical protein